MRLEAIENEMRSRGMELNEGESSEAGETDIKKGKMSLPDEEVSSRWPDDVELPAETEAEVRENVEQADAGKRNIDRQGHITRLLLSQKITKALQKVTLPSLDSPPQAVRPWLISMRSYRKMLKEPND